MEQYIPKSAVVAEIEKRKRKNVLTNEGAFEEDIDILSFINNMEVKEVDLEKEIDKVWDTDYEDFGILADDFYKVAKHFFELGLKAQKGEGV